MATAQQISFGFSGTQQPVGVTSTVRRIGIDAQPTWPGLAFPYACGRITKPSTAAMRRVRIMCDGACRIATEGTVGDPTSLGPSIAIPVGYELEVSLESGPVVFGVAGVVDFNGVFLEPAIGSNLFVVGYP